MAFRRDLVSALGGEEHLSPQRGKLVDLAARAALYLDHVDAWLAEQRSLVNARSRALVPVLTQRQGLADHLARLLDRLGLDRVPQRVPALGDILRDYDTSQPQAPAVAPGREGTSAAASDGGPACEESA